MRTVQPCSNKKLRRTRTNVAMQTILQMQHNLNLQDDVNSVEHPEDKAIKSLYSLPIESPTILPSDWLDESNKIIQDNDSNQSTPLYSNFNYLDGNGMNCTSVFSGVNSTSTLWDNGSSYSLFSGHSPLAKLLQDQKTKYDTSVIK